MAALGCDSRKELVALFVGRNPRSVCTLEALNKWMQGRAKPRASSFYSDWSAMLGLRHKADWLARAPLGAFIAEAAALTGTDAAKLARASQPEQTGAATVTAAVSYGLPEGLSSLAGVFACYNHSLVPENRGLICRGLLLLEPASGGGLRAGYREMAAGRSLALAGTAMIASWTLNIILTDPAAGVTQTMVFHLPGPTVGVLSGLTTSSVMLRSEALFAAATILAVRLPDGSGPVSETRYFEPAPGIIAQELAADGAVPSDPEDFDRRANAFLAQVPLSVSGAAQLSFHDDFRETAARIDRARSEAFDVWKGS